jgi:negative regulator of flagellin synthesis FlgM
MKISDTNAVAQAGVQPRQTRPAGQPEPTDTVSNGDAEKLARSVAIARQTAGVNRGARLQELEAAIKAGTYQPDPGRIANEILDAAQIDARLQALLSK